MEEKVNKTKEVLKAISKKLVIAIIAVVTLIGSFAAGFEYKKQNTPVEKGIEMLHIDRSQINLALDEHNHLLVIDKKSGNYTVYDDSVGVAIFKMYARNVQITQ
jgi:hypothetical protein